MQVPSDNAKRLFCTAKGMRAKDIGPCESSSSPRVIKNQQASGFPPSALIIQHFSQRESGSSSSEVMGEHAGCVFTKLLKKPGLEPKR
jgi:hypothetical protein